MDDYARWVLMRRMTSKRQLLEVMTEFFENHLHVAAVGDPQFAHRVDYGNTIRKHALGRFDQMLRATTIHPAMLIYLDAGESTKDHPNENLGRELLELHTVGAGNYTEKDVRDSARILTGYSVDYWESWRAKYNAEDHYRGKVKVKGFKDKNGKIIGKATTSAYLRYLAHHKDTAEHLAYKLCVKFIEDKPPKALVRHLARVYLDNDTAIVPVLRALVASRAFQNAHDNKVRDPGEDLVATYRVLGVKMKAPGVEEVDGSALQALVWQSRRDRHRAVLVGAAQRPAHRQRVVVLAGPADGVDAVPHGRRGRAGPTRPPTTASRSSGCRASIRGSTSWSTTCAGSCCTRRPARGCSRPAASRST